MMRPVPASLDRVNRADRYAEFAGDLALTDASVKKQSDCGDRAFIQDCSAVVRSGVSAMLDRVLHVFMRQTVCKVEGRVISSVAIQVPDDMSRRTRADEVQRNDGVNVQTLLFGLARSFGAAKARVCGRQVWFANESLAILDHCNPAKIADFVAPFVALNRYPGFRGVHG